MPSPTIPRSKSAPDISSPDSPSHTDIPPSNKSIRSTLSTGSSIASSWQKKFRDLFTIKTKTSNLTKEALHEFNRRNALKTRNSSSSPYYKGLTDFSLAINKEKVLVTSPGRESQATSFVTSVQEWGSCFSSKNQEKSTSPRNTETGTAVFKTKTKTVKKEFGSSERKKVTFPSEKSENTEILSTEKPLGEIDSEQPIILEVPPSTLEVPPSILAVPPPIAPQTEQPLASLPQTPISSPQECYTCPPPHIQDPTTRIPAAAYIYENRETNTTENERKYIWADKYRPFWLQDFLCNKKTALSLKNMVSWNVKQGKCRNFIFEGNPGVGKRTMIWAMLREAVGEDGVQARRECKKFYLKGEAVSSISVNLMVSKHHIEVNLSELKGYEKHVIIELIKENNENSSNASSHGIQNCKAIVLREADRISIDGLSYIKWMLETFKEKNKIIFCCSDSSKLQAVKIISTHIQLLEPSIEEILDVLAFIAEKEGIQLPHQLANKIAKNAKNNLRQAIRSFEATWKFNGRSALHEDQDMKTGWEDKIAKIARNVLEEQSPKQLYIIRGELQNLIEHNVAPEFIFETLTDELKDILPEQLKPQFDNLYEEHQQNHAIKYLASTHNQEEFGKRLNDQKLNVQHFMRIEEFIARFMSWYKGSVIKSKEVEEMKSNEAT